MKCYEDRIRPPRLINPQTCLVSRRLKCLVEKATGSDQWTMGTLGVGANDALRGSSDPLR